jgi:chemotaxis protein MotB
MNRQSIAHAGLAAVVLGVSLMSTACVSRGTYDEQVRAANDARTQLARCTADDQLLEKGATEMQGQLDDATAVDEQLGKELKRLGEDSQSLLAVNGTLKSTLDESKARLEELRRAQAAAEARAAVYRQIALKLKGMVDAGDLAITLRDGRMVLRLSNDVLFDSGKAELKPAGIAALTQIADVLRTFPGRRFQVAGHTDTEPIRFSPFHSNWELSTTRAVAVVTLLASQGVDPRELSAAGFGEFDPVDTNDTRDGMAHNRRTEITVQPNIGEIVSVPAAAP